MHTRPLIPLLLLLAALTACPAPRAAAQPALDRLRTREEAYSAPAAEAALADLARAITRDCPLRNTPGTWIDSVTYHADSSILHYYLRIDPAAMAEREYYLLKYVQTQELKRKLIASFLPDTTLAHVFSLLATLRGEMQWTYSRGKERFLIHITPADMDSARRRPVSEREHAAAELAAFVAQTNRELPRAIAQQLTLDSLTLDSLYLNYHFSASSARYNLDLLAAAGREKMLSSLRNSSGSSLRQLQLMRTAGLGFRVTYRDTASAAQAQYIIARHELPPPPPAAPAPSSVSAPSSSGPASYK